MRSGARSIFAPSASSTSAEPHRELNRAVAMFCDAHARACNHERRRGGNIKRAARIAACSGRINERFVRARMPRWKNRRRVAAHRFGKADNFVDSFALDTQRREQARDQRIARATRKNVFHRGFRFGARQVFVGYNFFKRFEDHRVSADSGLTRRSRNVSFADGAPTRRCNSGRYAAAVRYISRRKCIQTSR